MTEPSRLSPLRFSGQTFEVDAVGEIAEDVFQPSSTATPSGSPALQEVSNKAPQEPSSAPPPPAAAPPSDDAEHTLVQTVREPEPTQPRQEQEEIDPFDLAQLPGEPVRADALPPRAAYGAESTPTGVIDVFAAFLRKFPEAAKNESSWEALAPGFAGRIEFIVTLEKGERGLTLTIDENLPAPSYLQSSVLRTTNFLRHSNLAWRDGAAEGTQRLSLTARVERRSPGGRAPYSHGILAFGIHGEHQPNSAFFTYANGQHIEIEIQRIP